MEAVPISGCRHFCAEKETSATVPLGGAYWKGQMQWALRQILLYGRCSVTPVRSR